MNQQPPHPQPGSESAAEARNKTTRPLPTEDGDGDSDRLGPTANGIDVEDASLSDAKPHAIDRQFGAMPDVERDADPDHGSEAGKSAEVNDSFPGLKTD